VDDAADEKKPIVYNSLINIHLTPYNIIDTNSFVIYRYELIMVVKENSQSTN